MIKRLLFLGLFFCLVSFFSPQKVLAEGSGETVVTGSGTIVSDITSDSIEPILEPIIEEGIIPTSEMVLAEPIADPLPKEVITEEAKIVINEIYSHPNAGEVEWIELFNQESYPVILTDYDIMDGTTAIKSMDSYTISANGYLLLKKGIDFTFGLNDPGDIIRLKKSDNTIDQVSYGNWNDGDISDNAFAPAIGESIARIPNGHDTNNDKADFSIQILPTPGAKNTSDDPPPPIIDTAPTAFNLILPENEAELTDGKDINFSWESSIDPEGQSITYNFYLSCSSTFPEGALDSALEENEYVIEVRPSITCLKYFWKVEADDGMLKTTSTPSYGEFTLIDPVYSKNIIVNEILPHPSTGMDTEFIELYNNGDERVNIYGWFLDDAEGGSTPFPIPAEDPITDDEYWIEPGEYLVFYKSTTKLSLNDSGDSARLLYPDKTLASTCSYTTASLDLVWARDTDNVWQWSEKITPLKANIIYMTPDAKGGETDTEEEVIINKTPIKIKTNEFREYDQKLVAVTGTVISTSGNTFYLDDSTGQAKIYIQDKTGIDKPPMHKGDIFAIIGIVDLYRNTWRILPQKQSDVKLIKCIKDQLGDSESIIKAVGKVAVKSSTTSQSTTQARAPTLSALSEPIIKQVKAAEISPGTQEQKNSQNSIWLQIMEALAGLALIFLILLVISVRKHHKIKIIGGHFGDDET